MSETTKILFNSPALHSLKRDQLTKLCKIHSIKANGKNVDLVERLKQHAETLPKDDPLRIAAYTDAGDAVAELIYSNLPEKLENISDPVLPQVMRPSEQWEVVMESIQEVEETSSSQGTLSSLRTIGTPHHSGEFGTTNSKTSGVTSSLRAFATSLGLKRTNNKSNSTTSSKTSAATQEQPEDELTQHSIPYSAIQPAMPPLNDGFTFDPTTAPHTRMSFASNGEPLPGATLRPGVPAPDNARLSLGTTPRKQQPTTTIRLVSNNSTNDNESAMNEIFQTPKLKPFTPTFDLVMSPSIQANKGSTGAFWAPDTQPRRFQSLYPILTADDLPSPIKFPATDRGLVESADKNTLAISGAVAAVTTPTKATSDPFIFGSPLPQHSVSNTQFRATASSVLEEMNKRLLSSGVEIVNANLINKLQPGAHTQAQLGEEEEDRKNRETKPLPGGRLGNAAKGEITNKFNEAHKTEFAKMEGIDSMVKRRGTKSGENLPGVQPLVVGKKRKSSVLGDTGGAPRRPTTGPGAAAAAMGGKTSGTTRVISNGRRSKALPGTFDEGEDEEDVAPVNEDGREGRGNKRAKMDTDSNATTVARSKEEGDDAMDVDKEDQEEVEKNQRNREREAIKRKLDMSRAKRRSSAGGAVAAASARRSSRVSGARGPITPKTKSGRFGFLTSAKNLVASVWGRGKAAQPASNKDAPKPSGHRTTKEEPTNKSSLFKKKGPPSAPVSFATASTSGTSSSRLSVAQEHKPTSARSRSPLPPTFTKNPGIATSTSQMPSVQTDSEVGSQASHLTATVPASGGTSSLGTGLSATSNVGVRSMGIKPGHLRTSSVTSRLLAPTASSLAKTKKMDTVASPPPLATTSAPKPSAQTGLKKKSSLLSPITNSPTGRKVRRRGAVTSPLSSVRPKASSLPMWSPQSNQNMISGKIFSKPVVANGGSGSTKTPTLFPKPSEDQDVVMTETGTGTDGTELGTAPKNTGSVTKQRTFTRKPRISRSKVIARLASQRAAASSSSSRTPAKGATTPLVHSSAAARGLNPRGSAGLHKRTRSSIGARPGRASFTGPVRGANLGGGRGDKEMNVLASAKKRVRQSEYARRRSQASGLAPHTDTEN